LADINTNSEILNHAPSSELSTKKVAQRQNWIR